MGAGSSAHIGYDPGMPKATWNGATLASSDATRVVEGNHYFPMESVEKALLELLPKERKQLDAIIDGAGGDVVEKGAKLLRVC